MTSPSDVNVNNTLGGQNGNGGVLTYQFTAEALGRVTYSSSDNAGPYTTSFTPNDPVAGSAATYDQVASILRLLGGRHVDPFGNLVNPKKAWLIDWYWKLDGAPTPLTRDRLALYIKLANDLRPWPESIVQGFAAKNYTLPASEGAPQDYSKVDPEATLDSFAGGTA